MNPFKPNDRATTDTNGTLGTILWVCGDWCWFKPDRGAYGDPFTMIYKDLNPYREPPKRISVTYEWREPEPNERYVRGGYFPTDRDADILLHTSQQQPLGGPRWVVVCE